MTELIDIGANLTHDSFQPDFNEMLARAANSAISQMIVTGASAESSKQAQLLARKYPGRLYSTAGIHPHHATETTESVLLGLRELARYPEVKAIGETGLDFFRDFCPRDIQIHSFEQHIQLAIETGLPMFLHERDASETFIKILRQYRQALSEVVVHCFTGEHDALQAYIDMDCYIGITGWLCDERRGNHLIPLIRNIPADRLMLETDAPYLMPRNMVPKPKSRRNEPQNLTWVCQKVADTLGTNYEHIASTTTDNARRFFRL